MNNPWQPLLDSLNKFSKDFMDERNQPKQQERKQEDFNPEIDQ